MQSTDQLVELAKTGQREAISALVERYERIAVAAAWGILGDFHLAQDVTQDSFVTAFRQLSQLRSAKNFGSWLMTSVRRNAIRMKGRQRETTGGLPLAETVMQPEGWMLAYQEMLPMLVELPIQEYEVVGLRYLNGLSVSQIAEETSRPVGTVTKQLSRAIARLREMAVELEQ